MTCCSGFQNLLNNAGQRGISALVRETSNGINFLLQSRGVAFDDEVKLQPMTVDVIVNISCDVGLQFCPFCGKKLQELVRNSPDQFEVLAKKLKKFHNLHI